MNILQGKVAVVTGASRGVGRGIAIGLGEAGALVNVTGRTLTAEESASTGGLEGTVQAVKAAGGEARPIRCDHTEDEQVEALFERIIHEFGRIDVLVNSVWGGYDRMVEVGEFTWSKPFWEQPIWRWDAMFNAGVRAAYVSSMLAARAMVAAGSGLIVNISYFAARKHVANVAYGVSKAATDKLTQDMAVELKGTGVSVVALYPGLVRTEAVMQNAEFLDLSNSESPQFLGRAVAALTADPNVLEKSGRVLIAADLGLAYGFCDIDGKQPRPLTLDEV